MGIWCQNDVVSTLMRRHHVASTLIRRHFITKCPLGIGAYGDNFFALRPRIESGPLSCKVKTLRYRFTFFIIKFNLNHLENKFLLRPVLGGVAGVAHFSICHEQTKYNRVCYFHSFGVFPASKGSNYSGPEVKKLVSCSTQLSIKI